MLTERLRPSRMASIVGNEESRLEILRWLKNWKVGTKPVLLMGPPGVGKSTSIHAAAREYGYTVIEFNASDVRTQERLREAIGPVLENRTLFGEEEKLLVFFDEVDGIYSRSDRSGMEYIMEFIQNANVPVALAANVEDDPKLKKLTQKSLVLRFKPISEELVLIYLRSIAKRERISIPDSTLLEIARSSRGDVRSALNLLQTLSGGKVGGSHTDREFFSDASAIDHVFEATTPEQAVSRLRDYDARPYDKVLAVFNAVASARGMNETQRAAALNLIAEADMLTQRITGSQFWRLLRYLDRELALVITSKNLQRVESSLPWNVMVSIWNDGRVVRGLQDRLAPEYHIGRGTFSAFYLPYMAFIFNHRRAELDRFLARYGMADSEKRVLLKIAAK
jgi:replication factor C large subunit